ncbi:putative haloacid dehalogenase-like hydrolase [Gottschalkia purinilytica]|uniref:Putative haloacid dehalogenase-like hydrolase n=1 Tax=Gottschalkia purinilytica TaxID=1503 RepID=A0A0L0W8C7_GOTPU|nr:HAD family hydrolase [Gottschalkia purinilytica]KNF07520.1 putative haloacid dehalogenase-like hydrolase [Gottschalkia purinilytica]
MLKYNIPGRKDIEIENIVFDYNGTIAVDGKVREEIKELILKLKNYVKVHILTADTYGTVTKECESLGINVMTFPSDKAGESKRNIVIGLNKDKTICVGNGFNDIQMAKESAISIAVIGEEGCCGQLLFSSDIVVNSIEDAINIILNKNRVKATLRG